jgi:hypothetical protein
LPLFFLHCYHALLALLLHFSCTIISTFLALLSLLFSHCCFILLELLPLYFLHCYLILLTLPLFFLRFCLTHSFSIVALHIIVNFQILISITLDVNILTLLLFLFPIWFSISPPMCKLEFKHQGSNTKGEFLKVFLFFL